MAKSRRHSNQRKKGALAMLWWLRELMAGCFLMGYMGIINGNYYNIRGLYSGYMGILEETTYNQTKSVSTPRERSNRHGIVQLSTACKHKRQLLGSSGGLNKWVTSGAN